MKVADANRMAVLLKQPDVRKHSFLMKIFMHSLLSYYKITRENQVACIPNENDAE
jgi:hypothetical protein